MAPRKLNLSNTALLNKATARASSLFAVDEDRTYRELTLSQIQVNANQPRKHFDPVELEALAGEPMDVLVNGYLIAQGEVVVVNDKFGIRLTDIVTPSERMRRLSRG